MSKIAKGIGKAVGGVGKAAFKGLKKVAPVAKFAAPFIPGIGIPLAAGIGAAGGLLGGGGLKGALGGAVTGGLGKFGVGKLGKLLGGGVSKLGGQQGAFGGGSRFGQPGNSSESPESLQARIAAIGGGQPQQGQQQQGGGLQQMLQMLQGGQQGGQQQPGQQQGGGVMDFIGNLLGGGSTGANVGRLGALGAGAASLFGGGKARRSQEQFLQDIINQQQTGFGGQGGLKGAEDSFAARGPLREAAFTRLQSGLNRKAQGIFGR